ncbi:hypothetical protein G7B40_026405 [Aetokthonos hydrillicola Thurmond2011]|uniref:Uncharacterized protein n=1 Tax=Aetokthonos hydrillicola Thurmond2011 TaxID=2712845 RepID=A0AAP5IAX5_9CYAN|nr:hypothetical protein [Aetokthonos hydrillicola CCALA 1050]MBW4584902.1 hypothetical protein [Aetokthonos hydrillicola CCALA 1050]MDR9898066.1 hypothetical protein [Aetokthonos hydrillicola Thurmond2011]
MTSKISSDSLNITSSPDALKGEGGIPHCLEKTLKADCLDPKICVLIPDFDIWLL